MCERTLGLRHSGRTGSGANIFWAIGLPFEEIPQVLVTNFSYHCITMIKQPHMTKKRNLTQYSYGKSTDNKNGLHLNFSTYWYHLSKHWQPIACLFSVFTRFWDTNISHHASSNRICYNLHNKRTRGDKNWFFRIKNFFCIVCIKQL